jgi:FixJ family two-component response regulator
MSAIGKFMWDIPRLLVVEDEEDLNGLICNILIEEGYLCHNAYTAYEAVELILNNGDYLAILDYSLPDGTAKQIVEGFTDKGIELPFMVMTGYGDEEIAVEMMKLGARDYLIKDRSLLDILPTRVNQVMDQLRMEAELTQTRKYLQIALDESMKRSREMSGLLNAARDILEIPDFKSVAGSIFHSCKNLLGVKSGYVALLSEDGKSNEILLLDSGGIPCLVDPKLPMRWPIRKDVLYLKTIFHEASGRNTCLMDIWI